VGWWVGERDTMALYITDAKLITMIIVLEKSGQ